MDVAIAKEAEASGKKACRVGTTGSTAPFRRSVSGPVYSDHELLYEIAAQHKYSLGVVAPDREAFAGTGNWLLAAFRPVFLQKAERGFRPILGLRSLATEICTALAGHLVAEPWQVG